MIVMGNLRTWFGRYLIVKDFPSVSKGERSQLSELRGQSAAVSCLEGPCLSREAILFWTLSSNDFASGFLLFLSGSGESTRVLTLPNVKAMAHDTKLFSLCNVQFLFLKVCKVCFMGTIYSMPGNVQVICPLSCHRSSESLSGCVTVERGVWEDTVLAVHGNCWRNLPAEIHCLMRISVLWRGWNIAGPQAYVGLSSGSLD